MSRLDSFYDYQTNDRDPEPARSAINHALEILMCDEEHRYIYPPQGACESNAFDDPRIDGPAVVVHKDYKVGHLEAPKVGRRQHKFDSIEDLILWVERYANETTTEILVDDHRVTVIVNPEETSPEVVTCNLTTHPYLEMWIQKIGDTLGSRDVFRLLEIAPGLVSGPGDLDADEIRQKIGSLGGESRADRSEEIGEGGTVIMESAQAKRTLTLKIPSLIKLTSEVYLESDDVSADFDFWLIHEVDGSGRVTFSLECPGLAISAQAGREALAHLISGRLDIADDGAFVGLGTGLHKTAPHRPPYQAREITELRIRPDDAREPCDLETALDELPPVSEPPE